MKTYRNEKHDFEIDIPAEWSIHTESSMARPFGAQRTVIFKCRQNEAFNFQIGALASEPLLSETENEFRRYAQEKGYTSLAIGKIFVEGKEHVWSRYYMGGGLWSKKYMIVLNGIEYAITATCMEQKLLLEMEKVWDTVVVSFRLMRPADTTASPKREVSEQKNEITDKHVAEARNAEPQVLSKSNLGGVKTYRNEKHGFEIDMPEEWAPAPALAVKLTQIKFGPQAERADKAVFQYGWYDEAFNFEIGPLFPEPLLDDTEIEFRLYARDKGFTDLHFGRIMVAGREHVCAHYFINDKMGKRWNKKYMIVLGGIEYTITATCNDPQWFAKRENNWDSIIQSFRLLKPFDDSANSTDKAERYRDKRREVVQQRIDMRELTGDLYARAYEAVALGQFKEARTLLEKCLQEDPNHVLAHKELALVLERLGDKKGAIAHRREVERLNPSDFINRSNLEKLLSGSGGGKLSERVAIGSSYYGTKNSPRVPGALDGTRDESIRSHTFAFSIRSFLLITILSALFIHYRVGLKVFLALTSESHQPLSDFEFNFLSVILVVGIGAFVCLMFLLGVATIGQSAEGGSFFGFILRTMRRKETQKGTIGEIVFSDFTRASSGFLDAVTVQVQSLIHASTKILLIPFSIGQVNHGMMIIFVLWLILPSFILDHPLPVLWNAIYFLLLYYFCYRALLFQVAKLMGVSKDGDIMQSVELTAGPSLASSVKFVGTKGITPGFITEILNQETIVNAIKNDLRKTDQIGYKEVWRLGLITSEQDWFDPRPESASRLEGTKKFIKDINYRFKWLEQIPVLRTAALHSTGYFNVQLNNILISNGMFKHKGYPGWSYHLRTVLNPGEYIRIRNIQIETDRSFAENRSSSLAGFLREDGFPLKETYLDGDPLTAERGGVIIFDKDRILVTYPKYLTQRRLIDDEGNLVDLGIDEGFNLGGVIEVKMRPAELTSLVQYATSNGYTPILRYHSIPYASDFMVPILDAPISISGWADLFIDTRGKGKLFITREKTVDEWYEMMAKLRQLFYDELARKDYHLLGLTKDKAHLNYYLSKKLEILKEYYIIQDWRLF